MTPNGVGVSAPFPLIHATRPHGAAAESVRRPGWTGISLDHPNAGDLITTSQAEARAAREVRGIWVS